MVDIEDTHDECVHCVSHSKPGKHELTHNVITLALVLTLKLRILSLVNILATVQQRKVKTLLEKILINIIIA